MAVEPVGHRQRLFNDFASAGILSYRVNHFLGDYYCVDAEGKPLAVGLLRGELSPKSKGKAPKRTTIHVTGSLQERFKAYGQGTHADKMAQFLDAAEQTASLKRRLYNAEQRLQVAREHIDLLKTKQAEQPKRVAVTHTPVPDDWRDMSNAVLNGSQILGSADEKIRRAIEAVKAFNEGLEEPDQWALTPTVLQKLSGSNANRVRDYLSRHPEIVQMLEKYNKHFGYHQNRGKGAPRRTVKWPADYGAYEW